MRVLVCIEYLHGERGNQLFICALVHLMHFDNRNFAFLTFYNLCNLHSINIRCKLI